MARLKGMYATEAHMMLCMDGWRLLSSRLNPQIIFNVYSRNGEFVALLVSRETHCIEEVV